MRIVLVLFCLGTANSASLFTSHLADAEIEYGYRNNRLTVINIEYEQGSLLQPELVPQNIIPATSAAQTFYTVDDGRLEQIEPTHFTYSIGSGDSSSAAQIAPASLPVVQTYASPAAHAQPVDSMDMTYYKVDDSQLEQVNPTHVSYSRNAPSPAISVESYAAPASYVPSTDPFGMTYYNVDDGQLEQVNPTHISYSSPSQTFAAETFVAPAIQNFAAPSIPDFHNYVSLAVQTYAAPAVDTMSTTYYNVDDGQLEQVNPTHVSYSVSNSAPAAETYSAQATSVPVTDPLDMTYYKVDDGQLEQVNPTHMSYSAPEPVPKVQKYAAPTEVAVSKGPMPTNDKLDATYYKVDDGQLEQMKPTHVSYSGPSLGTATKNTNSDARVRTSSRGRVQQTLSNAPSTQYMPVESILGSTVTPTQYHAPLNGDINISGPQAVIEEAVVVPIVKSAEPEPYLVSGPVAEYVIPFGVDIPGVDFTSDGFSQLASAPGESVFTPDVASYSFTPAASAPAVDPLDMTYYKVDDGQLEQVNPTHMSYSAPDPVPTIQTYAFPTEAAAPTSPIPATEPLDATYYKVDEGKLEQVIPTHVSYDSTIPVSASRTTSRGRLQSSSAPAPVVETYSAPVVASAVDPAPATSLSETFYKVDDGQLEQVNPTHVSYNAEVSVSVNKPRPAVEKYSVPALLSIPEPSPFVSLLDSFYKVDDGYLDQVNPSHVSYSTHMSIPVHAPAPLVATYSVPTIEQVSVPAPVPARPLFETFYTVDDKQLDQVNPTHISYSTHTSVPASATYSAEPMVFSPVSEVAVKFDSNPINAVTNMLQTFYKQDDGKLEEVTPTHVSYSNTAPVATPVTAPVVKSAVKIATPSPWWTSDVKAAPQAPLWIPEPVVKAVTPAPVPTVKAVTAKPWWTPEPVVKTGPTSDAAVTHENSVLAITNMLQTFYKQDDEKFERVSPTHVSYNAPAALAVAPIPVPAFPTPAVKHYSVPELLSVVIQAPVSSVKIATPSPWWTPGVKAATPAPVPTLKKVTPSPWWNPDDNNKKDTISVVTSLPIIKSIAKSEKVVEIEVETEKAAVKQAVDEQSPTEEKEVEVIPAESKSTDEAEKGTAGPEDAEGSERAEDSEGSEGEEGSERAGGTEGDEGSEGAEGTEEEEGANTKSEDKENSDNEAETKSEDGGDEDEGDEDEEVSKYTRTASEEEEDSDEK